VTLRRGWQISMAKTTTPMIHSFCCIPVRRPVQVAIAEDVDTLQWSPKITIKPHGYGEFDELFGEFVIRYYTMQTDMAL